VTASDATGLIAGRYRLVSELGRGAMGVVWLARDERLGRTVAVKELRSGIGLSETQVQSSHLRARREARIAARLHHPHAVAIYDVAEHEGRPYLVMEYVRSRSLSEVLAQETVLTAAVVAEIGEQMASALVAAHKAGIVHRDIKPGNILFTDDGTAKLTDFGISRANDDVTVTATGEMLGTPAYVAPEVAQGRPASAASDVFSLGATLYAAVEGEPPFGTGPTAMALLLRIVHGESRPPLTVGPLTDTLMWMIHTDPEQRPTMESAQRSLRAIALASQPDAAAEASTTPISTSMSQTPASTSMSRRPLTSTPEPVDAPEEVVAAAEPAVSDDHPEAAPAPVTPAVPDSGGTAAERTRTSTPTSSRRRPLLWVVGIAVPVVVAGIVAALVANGSPSGPIAASSSTTTSTQTTRPATSPTPAASTKSTAASTSSATRTATGTASLTSATATATSTDTAAQLSSAISNYYKLVPNNLDQAFGYLTAAYQVSPAGGMTGYRAFWGKIQRVAVSNIVAQPPSTVTVTIDYYYKNGTTVEERTRFGLVYSGGIWKIASSSVLSSRTL
jgi:eukaryotic-like serine/threonine-protein kinase